METKYCPHCKRLLPVSEFYKDKANKDNLAIYCKACEKQICDNWRIKHLKQAKKISNKATKKWQKKYPVKNKLTQTKIHAKRRNYKWELLDKFVINLIQQPCYYCGQPANPVNGLDRVDNTKGYIINNVVPCCSKCNYMKKNMTIKEFLEHIEKIHKYNSSD